MNVVFTQCPFPIGRRNRRGVNDPHDFRSTFRMTMEDVFKLVTLWLAAGTEAVAALVIGLAVVEAALRAFLLFVPGMTGRGRPDTPRDAKEEVRRLAAIVVLRTVLNYFLQQEIDTAQARAGVAVPDATPPAGRV